MTETQTNSPEIIAPEVKKPLWRRILRISFISLCLFTGFIILAAVLIPLLFEDQIKRIFINELNKNLATEVVIDENDIDLTILKNFPDAAVVFNNIAIKESFPNSENYFLQVGQLSLLFNVMDIIHGNYVIDEIILQDGGCNLVSDKRGNINYKFWKDSESDSSSDFNIDLKKLICRNMDFSYRDFKHGQDVILAIHNMELTGNFSSDNYKMNVTGNILSKRINISGTNYLTGRETNIDALIDVDVVKDKYTFSKGEIEVDKNVFLLNGAMAFEGKNYYDISIKGDKINMQALALLLPGSVSKKFNSIESSGKLNFETTIKGYSTSTETPSIELKFSLDDATISHVKFGDKITDVSMEGVFSNGENHNASSSYITIKNFKGKQKNEPIVFSLDYRNFKNPTINLKLDGNLPASFLIPFVIPEATNVEGMISLQNINVKGNVKSFNYASDMPSGNIVFHGLSFENNGEKLSIPSGNAKVNNNEILLENISADLAGSDLILNLQLNNWLQNIFPSETKPALIINGSLNSKQIDLNKFLTAFSSDKEKAPSTLAETEATTPDTEETLLNFSGLITANVDEIRFDKLKFSNITTTLKLSPGMIVLDNLKLNTMSGNCELQASFREINNNLILETTGILNSIDIATLFDQFENFGQTTMTSKNIKGTLSANIYQLSISWDKNLNLIENSIYNKTNMKIESGQLTDYQPLETLSGFVNINDLRDIRFSTLENEIEINDSWIYIPAMKIESSALDLYMSGKHSFANEIDYQFKLSLADVLVRKFLGGEKKKENYEEDAQGGVNVYVSMTGTVDKPIISYNKKEVKQKLKESGLEEQKFIDIFKPDPDTKLFRQPDPAIKRDSSDEEEIEFIEFEDEGEEF